MAAVERTIILAGPDGSMIASRVRYHAGIRPPTLEVIEAPVGKGRYTNGDLWWCLIDFRKAVEPSGWRVLCNGARRDVWPSGMSADMSNGLAAYVLDPGWRRRATVNIFDPANADAVCTVEEQRAATEAFFAEWDRVQARR